MLLRDFPTSTSFHSTFFLSLFCLYFSFAGFGSPADCGVCLRLCMCVCVCARTEPQHALVYAEQIILFSFSNFAHSMDIKGMPPCLDNYPYIHCVCKVKTSENRASLFYPIFEWGKMRSFDFRMEQTEIVMWYLEHLVFEQEPCESRWW